MKTNRRFPTPKKWKPKLNPKKYEGDITNIIVRSSWETYFLNWCDYDDKIISYSSEEIVIPYLSEIDNKIHRYFPDAKIKVRTNNGVKIYIIEIKPYNQTIPSKAKRKDRFLNEMKVYTVNKNKWAAAEKWCKQRGYEFKILTERDLFNGRTK